MTRRMVVGHLHHFRLLRDSMRIYSPGDYGEHWDNHKRRGDGNLA